jgi:hypothetical protein
MPSYTIYASTNDFGVTSYSSTYSTARSGSGTKYVTDLTYPHYVDNSVAGGVYYCEQYFSSFDTSAVDGTQTARSFNFVAYELSGAGTVIEAAPHSWTTAESSGEFVAGASLPSPHGEVNANSNGAKSITLGTDVPVGSNTKYLLWAKGQRQNTTPAGADWIALYPADTSGTIDDPYLSITTVIPDVTPPTITSSATVSATFNSPLAHSLTADESVTWTIVGGADQASFEISGSTLRYASNANAVDGPRYVTVRATDASSNWTEQDITVRVYESGDTGLKTAASITGTGWTNADNARAADNSYATHTLASNGGTTSPLLPTSYSMGVPSGAEILGIQVAVERFASGNNIRDDQVQLRMAGANVGSDKGTNTNWPTSDTETTYGNSTDLWGLTPTASQINATDFGVAFGVRSATNLSRTISVDSIRVKVWWRDEKLASSGGTGSLSQTLGALTATSTATLAIKGSTAATLGALTVSGSGRLALSGSVNASLGALTSTATGKLALSGSLSATLGELTATATGGLRISGAVSATLGDLTLTATAEGALTSTGTLAATLDPLTASATGSLAISGAVSATLGAITLDAAGELTTEEREGSLAATLGPLSLASTGAVRIAGQISATLGTLTLITSTSRDNPRRRQARRDQGIWLDYGVAQFPRRYRG